MRKEVHGHYVVETGKIQHALRYTPSTFYKLVRLAEKDGCSVSRKAMEIIEKALK